MNHRQDARGWTVFWGAIALAAGMAVAVPPAMAQDAEQLATGKRVWNDANCAGCHGTRGQGGAGGDLPAGPSVRTGDLDHELLVEAISCGRPGTRMPAWLIGAYTEVSCYGFDPGPPPEGTVLVGAFTAEEIEALVVYIEKEFIGR